MTAYRVAYQYPNGELGSTRIGLPMSREDADHAAARANRLAGPPLKDEGRYVTITADTEKVVS